MSESPGTCVPTCSNASKIEACFVGCDAAAGVADGEDQPVASARGDRDPSRLRRACGVGDEVVQDLAQAQRIRLDVPHRARGRHRDRLSAAREQPGVVRHLVDDAHEVDRLDRHLHLAARQARQVEELRDQRVERRPRSDGCGARGCAPSRGRRRVEHHVGVADDGGRAQLVAHVRDQPGSQVHGGPRGRARGGADRALDEAACAASRRRGSRPATRRRSSTASRPRPATRSGRAAAADGAPSPRPR